MSGGCGTDQWSRVRETTVPSSPTARQDEGDVHATALSWASSFLVAAVQREPSKVAAVHRRTPNPTAAQKDALVQDTEVRPEPFMRVASDQRTPS